MSIRKGKLSFSLHAWTLGTLNYSGLKRCTSGVRAYPYYTLMQGKVT